MPSPPSLPEGSYPCSAFPSNHPNPTLELWWHHSTGEGMAAIQNYCLTQAKWKKHQYQISPEAIH